MSYIVNKIEDTFSWLVGTNYPVSQLPSLPVKIQVAGCELEKK